MHFIFEQEKGKENHAFASLEMAPPPSPRQLEMS
jgi:hypothetical protein